MALAIDELSSMETDLLAGRLENTQLDMRVAMPPDASTWLVAGLDLPLGSLDSPLSLLDDVGFLLVCTFPTSYNRVVWCSV